MIKIKNRPTIDQNWESDAQEILNKIKELKTRDPNFSIDYSDSSKINKKYSDITFDEDEIDIWKKLKQSLHKLQNNKCCYCENYRSSFRETDLEHFRPKGSPHGDLTHRGYWWLAYEPDNFLVACGICNRAPYKHNKFPLHQTGNRCNSYSDYFANKISYLNDLDVKEKPLLINPLKEEPSQYFAYITEEDEEYIPGEIEICNKKKISADDLTRIKSTINILGLNRTELNKERDIEFQKIKHLASKLLGFINLKEDSKTPKEEAFYDRKINKLKAKIKKETSAKSRFTGLRRYYFCKKGLREFINDD